MNTHQVDSMSGGEPVRSVGLARGDVALEDSIKLYERGAALKKRCEDKLKEAEEKVAAIQLDSDGNPTGLKPVEGL